VLAEARLAANILSVRERIARAAETAGRDPSSVRLVAVTKTHPPEVVRAAAAAGLIDFGENRIEEAAPKMHALADATGLRWHMIGHIQSRKARDVAQAGFALVHSVDTTRLAERLSRLALEAGARLDVLVELNVSGEASKAGFAAGRADQWPALVDDLAAVTRLPGLRVRGLMTMAPVVGQPEQARPIFRRLREVRDGLTARLPEADWHELSMGMTDDFEVAVAEGATCVRIGRALFGERG
jgi:pyridoxal phosphate enzyme (YggS family)